MSMVLNNRGRGRLWNVRFWCWELGINQGHSWKSLLNPKLSRLFWSKCLFSKAAVQEINPELHWLSLYAPSSLPVLASIWESDLHFPLSFSGCLFQGLNNQADPQKSEFSICRLIIWCEKWASNVKQKICRGFASLFCVREAGAECFLRSSGRAWSFPHHPRAQKHLAFSHLPEWGALLCAVELNAVQVAVRRAFLSSSWATRSFHHG